MAKFNSIRTLLAIAAAEGYTVQQMDVKTAFLNGELEEEIYMQQPEGTAKPGQKHMVWRLHRALYGLKQAPRVWYRRLDQQLVEMGFERCDADYSVYVHHGQHVILVVYVDDLVITGPDKPVFATKTKLASVFDMTDLGDVHWLLGMEIRRDGTGIHISQAQYIRELLERFGMTDCKPACKHANAGRASTDGEHVADDGGRTC